MYTQQETPSWSWLFFVSLQDVPRKHVTIKYSKYGLWQQNAAQRLRRGIPAILRSRKFRRQAEKKKGQEQAKVHKCLITLPSKLPPLWHPTEDYVSHKWRQDNLHRDIRVEDHSFVSGIISVVVLYILPPSLTHTCLHSSSPYSCCFGHQYGQTRLK